MNKIIAIVTALIIAGAAIFFLQKEDDNAGIAYQTITGDTLSANELKGKVVLVKFWATTCVTCIRQMPEMIEDYNTYKDKGFESIAVAVSYDDLEAIKRYTANNQLPFPVVYDKTGEVAKHFGGVRFTPIGFLLDKNGNTIKRYIGNYDHEEFIHTLEKALAQKN